MRAFGGQEAGGHGEEQDKGGTCNGHREVSVVHDSRHVLAGDFLTIR
jgi:hypothetical protein